MSFLSLFTMDFCMQYSIQRFLHSSTNHGHGTMVTMRSCSVHKSFVKTESSIKKEKVLLYYTQHRRRMQSQFRPSYTKERNIRNIQTMGKVSVGTLPYQALMNAIKIFLSQEFPVLIFVFTSKQILTKIFSYLKISSIGPAVSCFLDDPVLMLKFYKPIFCPE